MINEKQINPPSINQVNNIEEICKNSKKPIKENLDSLKIGNIESNNILFDPKKEYIDNNSPIKQQKNERKILNQSVYSFNKKFFQNFNKSKNEHNCKDDDELNGKIQIYFSYFNLNISYN